MSVTMVTISQKRSARDVARMMVNENISSVAITMQKNKIAGILTERDIARAVARGVPPDGVTAGSLMTSPVVSISKDSSIKEAARAMAANKIRHLLVTGSFGQRVVGMITLTDLARYLRDNPDDEVIADSEVWELFF